MCAQVLLPRPRPGLWMQKASKPGVYFRFNDLPMHCTRCGRRGEEGSLVSVACRGKPGLAHAHAWVYTSPIYEAWL